MKSMESIILHWLKTIKPDDADAPSVLANALRAEGYGVAKLNRAVEMEKICSDFEKKFLWIDGTLKVKDIAAIKSWLRKEMNRAVDAEKVCERFDEWRAKGLSDLPLYHANEIKSWLRKELKGDK